MLNANFSLKSDFSSDLKVSVQVIVLSQDLTEKVLYCLMRIIFCNFVSRPFIEMLTFTSTEISKSFLTGKHPVIRYRVFLLRDCNANIIARLVNISSAESRRNLCN